MRYIRFSVLLAFLFSLIPFGPAHGVSWDVANEPQFFLNSTISATATTITLAPPEINGETTVMYTQSGGMMTLRQGGKREDFYFTLATNNPSTNVVTLTGVIRNVCRGRLTSIVSCGNGKEFTRGALAEVTVDSRLLNLKANKDRSNVFSGSGAISFTGSGTFTVPKFATTAVRDQQVPSPVDGMIVYVNADTSFYKREGSAWTTIASGSTPSATESVAGKVQLGTVKDQSGATLLGSTGAPTVVQTRYLTGTGGSAERFGRIPYLSKTGTLSGNTICTGNQYRNGGRQYCSGTGGWVAAPSVGNMFLVYQTLTGSNLVSGTTNETNLNKQFNLTGGLISAGDVFIVKFQGHSENAGGSNSTRLRFKFGSANVLIFPPLNNKDAAPVDWFGEFKLRFVTVGSSAMLQAYGQLQCAKNCGFSGATGSGAFVTQSLSTINLNSNPTLIPSLQMGNSTAGNNTILYDLNILKGTSATYSQ